MRKLMPDARPTRKLTPDTRQTRKLTPDARPMRKLMPDICPARKLELNACPAASTAGAARTLCRPGLLPRARKHARLRPPFSLRCPCRGKK